MDILVCETKSYNLSTRSSSCINLNGDYKSLVQYNVLDMIEYSDNIEYILWSIPYAIVPVSFYTVNATNNVLNLTYNGSNYSFTFEFGNYNVNYFISQFNILASQHNVNITVFFDATSSCFNFTSICPFTLLSPSSIDYIIGFSSSLTATLSNHIYALELPRPCNFLPLPRVIMRCPQLAGGNFLVGTDVTSDVVLTIPNNARINSQIIYENDIKHLLLSDKLTKLDFSFTDDDGNLINFNGLACFFTLQFDIYKRKISKPLTMNEIKEIGNKQPTNNFL